MMVQTGWEACAERFLGLAAQEPFGSLVGGQFVFEPALEVPAPNFRVKRSIDLGISAHLMRIAANLVTCSHDQADQMRTVLVEVLERIRVPPQFPFTIFLDKCTEARDHRNGEPLFDRNVPLYRLASKEVISG